MFSFWKKKNKETKAGAKNGEGAPGANYLKPGKPSENNDSSYNTQNSNNDDIYQEDITDRGDSSAHSSTSSEGEEYEKSTHQLEKDADKVIKNASVESKYRMSSKQESDTKVTYDKEGSSKKEEKKLDGQEAAVSGDSSSSLEEEKEISGPGKKKEMTPEERALDAAQLKFEADFEVARQSYHAKKGVFDGILSQLGEDLGLSKIDAKKAQEIMNGQNVSPGHAKAAGYVKPQPDYPTQPLPGAKKNDE